MEIINHELNSTPEYKNHLYSLMIIQLSGVLIFAGFIFFLLVGINKNVDSRIFSVAAIIENKYPESVQDVIPLLLNKISLEDVKQGQALLADYGYDSLSSFKLKTVYSGMLPTALTAFIIISIILLGTNYIIYTYHQKHLFKKIRDLSACVMSILDGRPKYGDNQHNEGIWDLFVSRFNQMVKKMQASADLLVKDKDFLANILSDISHQLKTPLASMIMYNDLLRNEPDMERDTQIEFLEISRKQLLRMEWLIKSLLKLASLESGTITFAMHNFDPVEPLNHSLENLAFLVKKRHITISDNRAKQTFISGDENWLNEAFTNIIKNAIQHTDSENGSINISLDETAIFLRISIRDNGSGIPKEQQPRVFERFFKGGNSTDMESVGIGLPLSKMIIEAHGGEIRVDSHSNSGAGFIITLPY